MAWSYRSEGLHWGARSNRGLDVPNIVRRVVPADASTTGYCSRRIGPTLLTVEQGDPEVTKKDREKADFWRSTQPYIGLFVLIAGLYSGSLGMIVMGLGFLLFSIAAKK